MTDSYQGVRNHIHDHWPGYAAYTTVSLLLLLAIWIMGSQGWWAFALFAAALLLLLFYFLAAGLLLVRRQSQSPDLAYLFELGQIKPTDRFVQMDVGRRDAGIFLSHRLTTGKVSVIDLYNPQLTPDPSLWRARQRLLHPRSDPRLVWLDGALDLIPLPDNSAPAVILVDTLGQFVQAGDRRRLLAEAYRILTPGGRLLLSERTRTLTNWLALGPAANRLPEAAYWRDMLREAGFHIQHQRLRHDVTTCFRADKPATAAEYQLTFKLNV